MTEDQERILNGRYRVESLIGRGGMADVYLSHDISLDRRVAVKMLRPDLARDPQFQTRFRREAQSSASLNHHNIVGVYDTGQEDVEDASQHPVKVPYMVMEFVDGVTLRHILHGTPRQTDHTDSRHTDPDGPSADFDDDATRAVPPPPPGSAHSDPSDSEDSDSGETDSDVLAIGDTGRVHEGPESLEPEEVEQPLRDKIEHALGRPLNEGEAAGYLTGILAALGYSHRKGIVHRDIKPSNVMVDQQGNIKVMDFGIARAVADSASTMTQTSAVVGTAQYLSPEQARGEVVDHRSDLYSAGCVLFELLTNRPPFQGDSPVAVAYQHVREQAPRVSDFNPMVSPAMESVVGRALTKEPGRRFQTASEFSAALQDALRGIPVYDEEETAAIGMVPAMAGVGAGAAGADPAPSTGAPLSARTPEDPALYAEADDYPPRRRGRAGRVLLWLLLVLILAAGAAWALAEMLSPQRVEIPDIEGMSRTDAVSELNEQNLDPEIETEPHDDIDEDLAIRTDPGAGEQVDAESPITLYISAGQDSVVIPDGLQGQSEDEVRETFDELGLEIGEITDDTHPSVEEDRLISTDPEAGETVSQGSSVDLVMSNGQVVMPGVFNTNQYDAQAVLEDLELSVEFVESENGQYTPGTVIGQQVDGSSVQAGDLIPQQSTVTLSIATAPPPPPEDDGDDEDEDDPTDEPTSDEPSESPTDDESEDPSESPTDDESEDPSESPTDDESDEPTESPTDEESETDEPSPSPSPSPTEDDDESDEPSESPTGNGSPTNDD